MKKSICLFLKEVRFLELVIKMLCSHHFPCTAQMIETGCGNTVIFLIIIKYCKRNLNIEKKTPHFLRF